MDLPTIREGGKLKFYWGEGRFTEDRIPNSFFGCAGVAEIDDRQNVLQKVGYGGHRRHVSIPPGQILAAVQEAYQRYLGYEVDVV